MKETRCKCGALLMKGNLVQGWIEIKCKKCKTVTKVVAKATQIVDNLSESKATIS